MTINALPVTNAVRQPRAVVKLNGQAVPGWISWNVLSNSYYEADTWRVSFALSQLPKSNDANWFSLQQETFVEIFAGFPTNPDNPDVTQLQSLIYGRIDEIQYDPVGTLIDLRGRDLAGAFIDNRLIASYSNHTASYIATKIASARGLNTGLITATSTKVGVYYQRDQVYLSSNRSEWDMLCYLARHEKFVCFVTGQNLYFGPDPLPDSNPYKIAWTPGQNGGPPSSNALALSFSRSQTVAKGVTVQVRSADLDTGRPTVVNYPSVPRAIQAGKASPFGNVQPYYVDAGAGHSPEECQQIAEAKYREIISHEMKLEARLPGDNLLSPRRMIELTGTGTAFDQLYVARSVSRSMSRDEGYVMTVQAQNPSAALEESGV
jgi:phage protein D